MDNLPGLITAVVALIAAIGAIAQNRAGRRDGDRQARAAQELERREQAFTESEAALDAHKQLGVTYREEITRINAERDHERERHAAALARKDALLAERAEELIRARTECSQARADLADMVSILSEALRSEVYTELTAHAMEESKRHGDTTTPPH